jgi:hypothetical protein
MYGTTLIAATNRRPLQIFITKTVKAQFCTLRFVTEINDSFAKKLYQSHRQSKPKYFVKNKLPQQIFISKE